MSISLTSAQERPIQSKLQSGRYRSIEKVLELALRSLDEYDRHLQATRATLIEVAKSAYEKSLMVKAIIPYLDKLSEEPNHGA